MAQPKKNPSKLKKPTKTSKAVVGKGTKGSGSWWNTRTFQAIALVFVLVFAAVGVHRLYFSHAATSALSAEQCYNRGRAYTSSTGVCQSYCLSGAGSYITSGVTYAYCSNANSLISSTICSSKGRNWNEGSGGCARRWSGSIGNTFTNAWQCANNSYTYVMADPYDYCRAPSSTTTTSTGWQNPIAGTIYFNQGYSTTKPHYGVDIRASVGQSVYAVNSGSINWAGNIGYGCGNGMILTTKTSSGATVYAVYQHMNPVKYSGSFSKGDVVGYVQNVGVTSCWTGAHLHFGVQNVGGTVWSPTNFDRAGYFYNPCSFLPSC
jgi:hypothetical protein